MAAEKTKEQEIRTREVITKQEQMHVTHEQVKMAIDLTFVAAGTCVDTDDNHYHEECHLWGTDYQTSKKLCHVYFSTYWAPKSLRFLQHPL